MREALLYEQMAGERVRCNLCGHRCVIANGKRGVCQVRQNKEGVLYTRVYGETISRNIDPVEKKPLYHFQPGTSTYSIATVGCNFQCEWCQNWEIAQMPRRRGAISGIETSPEEVVSAAWAMGCRSVAYTYTEPTVFFEYSHDTAKLAREAGLANIYVTNGYMSREMLDLLHPNLDAANVDLKSFRKKTYQRYVRARLQSVLDSLIKMRALGIWVEVTTLVIPGINDEMEELREMAQFIARELGSDTPWHLSRFFPGYRMQDRPPTPLRTLQRGREIGLEEGLRYVYVGNVLEKSDTNCPKCGELLIVRNGYAIVKNSVGEGCCPTCGMKIAGVWLYTGT